jgi:hypothetical protein
MQLPHCRPGVLACELSQMPYTSQATVRSGPTIPGMVAGPFVRSRVSLCGVKPCRSTGDLAGKLTSSAPHQRLLGEDGPPLAAQPSRVCVSYFDLKNSVAGDGLVTGVQSSAERSMPSPD